PPENRQMSRPAIAHDCIVGVEGAGEKLDMDVERAQSAADLVGRGAGEPRQAVHSSGGDLVIVWHGRTGLGADGYSGQARTVSCIRLCVASIDAATSPVVERAVRAIAGKT